MTLVPAMGSQVQDGAATARRDRFWSRLTMSRRKWRFYRDEPGFMTTHARLVAELGPAVIDALQTHAIALLKPEAMVYAVTAKPICVLFIAKVSRMKGASAEKRLLVT